LRGSKLPQQFSPFQDVPGQFLVEGQGDQVFIAPSNFSRYAPWIHLLDEIELKQLGQIYIRFYPAMQKAYEYLGKSDYFNDQVIKAIDDLLQTPEAPEKIRVVKPQIYYRFADPELESLHAGQKILLRVGPENSQILRLKLRELRALLANLNQSL